MKILAAVGGCALTLFALAGSGRVALAAEEPDPSSAEQAKCKALTARGPRTEAVMACTQAYETVRSSENMRAMIGAFVDGPSPPTSRDLGLALQLTTNERDRGGTLTAAAATCDIAERMGDLLMLERCTQELLALAPGDPATIQAQAALEAASPRWRFWTAWGALAATLLATAAHALLRRGRRRVTATALAAAVMAFATLASSPARADDPPPTPQKGWLSKWPVDDDNPEKSIPPEKERNADPLDFGYWLQDVTWKAEQYAKRGNHVKAAGLFKLLGLAVPDRAVGYTKACDEYEAAGDREQAIEACGQAILRNGAMDRDFTHFVNLILDEPGALTKKQVDALGNVIAHLRQDPGGKDIVDELECRVGARTSNVAQLQECTAGLQARAPDNAQTISYLWALAVARGEGGQATALIARARAAGVPEADLAHMTETTDKEIWKRRERLGTWVLVGGLLLAAIAVLVRGLLTRKRAAAPQPPAPLEGEALSPELKA